MEKIQSLTELFTLAETYAQANSKILLGFGEVLVLHKHFCLEQFTIDLRKTVQTLLTINKVFKVVVCTVPPDVTRLSQTHYSKALRSVNSRIWIIKKQTLGMYVLDIWGTIVARYAADNPEPDRRNLTAPRVIEAVEGVPRLVTESEVAQIDKQFGEIITSYVEKPREVRPRPDPNRGPGRPVSQNSVAPTTSRIGSNDTSSTPRITSASHNTVNLVSDVDFEDGFQAEIDAITRADAESIELSPEVIESSLSEDTPGDADISAGEELGSDSSTQ